MTIFFFFSFYGELKTFMNVVEALEEFEVSILLLVLAYDAPGIVYIDFELTRYGNVARSCEVHSSFFCVSHPDVSDEDDQ